MACSVYGGAKRPAELDSVRVVFGFDERHSNQTIA